MMLSLIHLALFVNSAYAQTQDTLAITAPHMIVDPTQATAFSYAFVGKTGHEFSNIWMELMFGKSPDSSSSVADIIAVGYSQKNGNSIPYALHASTPAGSYHVRMNGTISEGTTSLDTIVAYSAAINITLSNSYQCATPAFTPVRSVFDPGYSPLRLAMPAAGAVFLQNTLHLEHGNITGTLSIVNASSDTSNINATLELVSMGTGASTAVQQVPQPQIDERMVVYSTKNITLTPGTWKLRMNFTDPTAEGRARLSSLSDEFYVVLAMPCVGLPGNSTSTSSIFASSTAKSPSSPTIPGSVPGSSPSSSSSAPEGASTRLASRFSSTTLVIQIIVVGLSRAFEIDIAF
ncbi:hypothetical protein B0H13DRAFT_2002127 [Mycena leptocephala]|nr:hypothetical protein B0H13DRAFT_2002127 [Mycena leptocephala]